MKPALSIITPSYAGDRERCDLLCQSIDRTVHSDKRGDWEHLILVADEDEALFADLAGPKRRIICDRDILPRWLRPFTRPFSRRKTWLSTKITAPVWPMSGWHVQQFRKLAAARLTDAPVLLMADSDTIFVRSFGPDFFWRDEALRLYVKPDGISLDDTAHHRHRAWCNSATDLLQLPKTQFPCSDYISNLVTWRRDLAVLLVARIESLAQRDFIAAMGRHRQFSEYMLYGFYADQTLPESNQHWRTSLSLALTYWDGKALDAAGLAEFLSRMHPSQLAFGIQSFTGTEPGVIRAVLETLPLQTALREMVPAINEVSKARSQ